MPKFGLDGRDANTNLAFQFAPCLCPHGLNHAGGKGVGLNIGHRPLLFTARCWVGALKTDAFRL